MTFTFISLPLSFCFRMWSSSGFGFECEERKSDYLLNFIHLLSLSKKYRNPSEKLFCLVFQLQVTVPVH